MKEVALGVKKLTLHKRSCHRGSDNAPHASRARAVAKLAPFVATSFISLNTFLNALFVATVFILLNAFLNALFAATSFISLNTFLNAQFAATLFAS
jgi:uncharacterized protein YqhQ